MNLKTIKDRIAAILADKSSGITPEAQKKIDELTAEIDEFVAFVRKGKI